MKRHAKLAVCLLLAIGLAGCGLKDGTYTARLADFDSLGYQDYLTVTVAGGAIQSAEFDALDAAGQKKSEDERYARLMQPVTGATPQLVSSHYAELLLGAKSAGKVQVDAVSGATVSSRAFKALWQALDKPMKKGLSEPVTVPNPPELPLASGSE
ncbi:FMN-binding protein [Allofournierella sp.]|uniref:FMN-binding protein n=1 Tax=Allofournierella sp. TaxID=1940256 RepID=UPI003AF70D66